MQKLTDDLWYPPEGWKYVDTISEDMIKEYFIQVWKQLKEY